MCIRYNKNWLKSSKRLFTPGRFNTIQYTFSFANNNAHSIPFGSSEFIVPFSRRQNAQNLISKHKFLTHKYTHLHIFKSFRILKNEIQSSISLPLNYLLWFVTKTFACSVENSLITNVVAIVITFLHWHGRNLLNNIFERNIPFSTLILSPFAWFQQHCKWVNC